jgi:hypothetical protein
VEGRAARPTGFRAHTILVPGEQPSREPLAAPVAFEGAIKPPIM